MIPVLALQDPAAGAAYLRDHLGFAADPADPLLLDRAGQRLRLVGLDQRPEGFIDLPFDHLAMRVVDVDRSQALIAATGAVLHPDFTPDGPVEIAEFGPSGVRYIFFRGPEGWPFEFLAPRGPGDGRVGHDHFGLRHPEIEKLAARLHDMGAVTRATHRLGTGDAAVNVAFLSLGDVVFELFDAPPPDGPRGAGGWVGFLP